MGIAFIPQKFSAPDRARITGMPETQKRNLRRHGYIEKRSASGPIVDIGVELVAQALGDRGVPPAGSIPIAKSAGTLVAFWAQQVPGAVSDPKGLARGELPVKASPAMKTRFMAYGAGGPRWPNDLADIYGVDSVPADLAAAIILDLKSLARLLVERAGKPLWTVAEDTD